MMKKLLIALIVMMTVTSCNSFKINVNLENSNGKTVYLQRYDGEKMNNMDSVVAENNRATFKVKKSDYNDAFGLMVKGWRRPLTLFADNQDVMVTGDYQDYNGVKIVASESQEKLNKFMHEVNNIEDENEIHHYVLDFVKQNIDNPVGTCVLYRYKWDMTLSELEYFYNIMPTDMNNSYKDLVVKYIKGLQMTEVGMPFIDFIQKDVNGENFTLSSVIGKSKVLILDFWASWCPDCRKENPGLVAIYNEYKDKGLDIVSVSFDVDEAVWKKAIEDDNLSWKHHVSDLKGWNNATAELYTIGYIPQNIIFDENGIIVKKNVPTERLKEVMESLLN